MIMVGMNAGTMVINRNSSMLARAALLTLGAAMALAGGRAAYADGVVVCWGLNNQGQCNPPTGLGDVTAIDGGGGRTIALKADGSVTAWGDGSQTTPGLGVVTAIAAGENHTVVLKADGSVAAWGDNQFGQCNAPTGLGVVTAIAAGAAHTVAIKVAGSIAAWGWNFYGQCSAPAGLVGVTDIAAGSFHTVALKADGMVVAWGNNDYGQCSAPAGLGTITAISAGAVHTVAIQSSGSVVGWGYNVDGRCNIPAGLGVVTAIAAGDHHTVALRADGTVAAWGRNDQGQCDTPAGLPIVTAIAAGREHTVALFDNDCNNNSVPDLQELDGHDCNGNLLHDSCEIAIGTLEDCNDNNLDDSCEKQLTVNLTSGHLGPIGFKSPVSWTIPNAVLAAAPVTLRVRGQGDFSGQLESITVRVGTLVAGIALGGTNTCGLTPWASFTLPDSFFNAGFDSQGDVTIRANATIAVNAQQCPTGTWIEFELDYTGATPADCNANGLLDSCEIAAGWAVDGNGNGILDICESGLAACPADFDQNGFVDASDLAQILNAWGPAPGLPGLDLVPDGIIDGGDLAVLLNAWGMCAE